MNLKIACTMIVLLACGIAAAQPTIACDYQEINEKIWDTAHGSWNDKVENIIPSSNPDLINENSDEAS